VASVLAHPEDPLNQSFLATLKGDETLADPNTAV